MPTRNINLTEHFDRFIETGMTSGRFSNASEVVREGLRLLEQREEDDRAKLAWLRASAREGFDQLNRGEGIAFESMDDFEAFVDQIGQEVSADIAAQIVETSFPGWLALPARDEFALDGAVETRL